MIADGSVSNASDPASLENLNDVIVPDAVSWWPPANGWYLLGALSVLLAFLLLGLAIHRWWSRRYRRQAIAELHQIQALSGSVPRTVTIAALDRLLKRVALAAWPRELVANLSGHAWLQFLRNALPSSTSPGRNRFGDASEPKSAWTAELKDLAYSAKRCEGLTAEQLETLFFEAERWIRQHRVDESSLDLAAGNHE